MLEDLRIQIFGLPVSEGRMPEYKRRISQGEPPALASLNVIIEDWTSEGEDDWRDTRKEYYAAEGIKKDEELRIL